LINLKTAIKLAAVAILTVGVFSAGLFGFNRVHLTATTSGSQTLPPLTSASNSHDFLAPADFTPPQLTIIERTMLYGEMPTHYLSANDAALLVAKYAWEVFGICLDGRTIAMHRGTWYASHRTYWRAIVYSEVRAAEHMGLDMQYIFGNPIMEHQDPLSVTIDAITGERLNIILMDYRHPPRCDTLSEHEIMDATIRREHALINGEPDPMDILALSPTQLDMFSAIAMGYALRHLGSDVELLAWHVGTSPAYSLGRDAHGNIVYSNYLLYFGLTCNEGSTVYVTLSYVSGQAVSITTLGNPMTHMHSHVIWATPRPVEPTHELAVQTGTIASRVSDSFVAPALVVYEIPGEMDRETRARANSPETAALYVAMYIWELFGNCLNGFAVEMTLAPSQDGGALWQGTILPEPCEYRIRHGSDVQLYRARDYELFSFNINAFTGELISVRRTYNTAAYICATITASQMKDANLARVYTIAPVQEFDQEIGRYVYVKTLGGQMIGLTHNFTEPVVITRNANGDVVATDHNMFFEVLFTPVGGRPGQPRTIRLSLNANSGEVIWSFMEPE